MNRSIFIHYSFYDAIIKTISRSIEDVVNYGRYNVLKKNGESTKNKMNGMSLFSLCFLFRENSNRSSILYREILYRKVANNISVFKNNGLCFSINIMECSEALRSDGRVRL
jgi:hypothetical protein